MTEWHPASTAPKDRPILTFDSETGLFDVAYWDDEFGWGDHPDDGGAALHVVFDLWCELPERPKLHGCDR